MLLERQSNKNYQDQHGFKTTLYSIQQNFTTHTMIFKARVKYLKHLLLLSSIQFLKLSIRFKLCTFPGPDRPSEATACGQLFNGL